MCATLRGKRESELIWVNATILGQSDGVCSGGSAGIQAKETVCGAETCERRRDGD
jgi:hypothetical protein